MTAADPRPPAGPLRATLLSLPAWLSLWALAAHFLRDGNYVPASLCAGAPLLLFARETVAVRIVQLTLLAGAFAWLLTAQEIFAERLASGRPYLRMLAILGGVALLDLFAAALLEAPSMRRRRALGRPTPPEAA